MCLGHGVIPKKFITDNGSAFTSGEFKDHLKKFDQVMKNSAPGAHHHNAVAERAIYMVTSISRAMLIHAAIHWPDVTDPQTWPMAVAFAVWLINHVPTPETGLSPHDVFTKTRFPQSKFHDIHVFGCPAYVLRKKIADGHKIPRWQPRSDRRQHMGCGRR